MTGIQCKTQDDGRGYDLLLEVRRDAQGRFMQGLCLGETTPQNQAFLLAAHKGEFKEHPTVGVGLSDALGDHDFAAWKRAVAMEFERDGMRIERLEMDAEGLTVEARY